MKKFFMILAAVAMAATLAFSCQKPADKNDEEEEEEEIELVRLKCSVPVTDNWVFEGVPSFTIHAENPNPKAMTADIKVTITTDLKQPVTTFETSDEVPANGSKDIAVTLTQALEPGFYKAQFAANSKLFELFCFGVKPAEIQYVIDKQDDFDSYWENAKALLPDVTDPDNVVLTPIPSRSSSAQKVYFVEMKSAPDAISGDPVVVRGYYLEPLGDGKYPILMHFFGYDSQPPGVMSCPYGSSNPTYAEFYLSTRGQMINARSADKREDGIDKDFTNTYGDWFAFQFGNLDGYYYHGAYLDCVQAVNFMASRSCWDGKNLFGEGSSQGGAFSYAAASLSDYPFTAIAPCVAFMGDFPEYFKIVSWPGDTAKANQGSMSDEEMYRFLSYFDTKNLVTRMKNTAVLACSGLQDGTCPPRTNTAPFNTLSTTDKEMYYYPELQHQIPKGWTSKYSAFFEERMK